MLKLFYIVARDQTQIFNAYKTDNILSELWPQPHNWVLDHLIPSTGESPQTKADSPGPIPTCLMSFANPSLSLPQFLWTETH